MNGVRMWLDREEENRVIFLLFSCYTRKLREWFAVIRIVSRTHTCSYLLGTHIFVFTARKNHTLYDRVDSNCVPPACSSVYLLSCDDLLYSYHTWKVRVYFACSFVVIRKYNRTLSTWLRTCRIFILLLSRKNRVQKKNVHDLSLPQQELARISKFSHSSMFGSRFGTVRLGHNAPVSLCRIWQFEFVQVI